MLCPSVEDIETCIAAWVRTLRANSRPGLVVTDSTARAAGSKITRCPPLTIRSAITTSSWSVSAGSVEKSERRTAAMAPV